MPKSRRQKDNDEFNRVFFGGESSSISAERDRSGREKAIYKTAFTTPGGTMLLYPQTDVDFEDLDTSVLPPHNARNGRRDDVKDLDRFFEWAQTREMKKYGGRMETISRKEVHHIRYHDGVGIAVNKLLSFAEKSGDCFIISLDTEGGDQGKDDRFPSTLQLSGKFDEEEYNVVFQLKSELVKSPSQPPHYPKSLTKHVPMP